MLLGLGWGRLLKHLLRHRLLLLHLLLHVEQQLHLLLQLLQLLQLQLHLHLGRQHLPAHPLYTQ